MASKNILIIGASKEKSIGSQWGHLLAKEGHQVTLASRTGSLGHSCDISDGTQVENLVKKIRPSVLIHAAGTLLIPTKNLTTERAEAHFKAKVMGAYNCFRALENYDPMPLILVGGETRSNDPKMDFYCTINRLVLGMVLRWQKEDLNSCVPFVHYLSLPPVIPSTMMDACVGEEQFRHLASRAISIEESYEALVKLF